MYQLGGWDCVISEFIVIGRRQAKGFSKFTLRSIYSWYWIFQCWINWFVLSCVSQMGCPIYWTGYLRITYPVSGGSSSFGFETLRVTTVSIAICILWIVSLSWNSTVDCSFWYIWCDEGDQFAWVYDGILNHQMRRLESVTIKLTRLTCLWNANLTTMAMTERLWRGSILWFLAPLGTLSEVWDHTYGICLKISDC